MSSSTRWRSCSSAARWSAAASSATRWLSSSAAARWSAAASSATRWMSHVLDDSLAFFASMLLSVADAKGAVASFLRATAAYSDAYDSVSGAVTLTAVASGEPRICTRLDGDGNVVTGYMAEEARTNVLTYSHLFGNASWFKNLATITADQAIGPDGNMSADKFASGATGGPNTLYRYYASITTAAWTHSFVVKAGTANWCYIGNSLDGAGCRQWVNLQTGAAGSSSGTPGTLTVEGLGDGWYNISLTKSASAGNRYVELGVCDGNGSTTSVLGEYIYVWAAQLELGATPSSQILTVGAAATRNKDELQYVAPIADPTGLTIYCEVLVQDGDDSGGTVWQMSDGGSAADMIKLAIDATTGYAHVTSAATAGSAGDVQGDTVDCADGVAHQIMVTIEDGSLRLIVDGSEEGTEDTSVTLPDDLDEFDVGQDASSADQINGLVSNLRVYEKALPSKVIVPSWQ